jgi:transcription elongation factor GreA
MNGQPRAHVGAMGCSPRRYAVRTSSPARRRSTMVLSMAATPTVIPPSPNIDSSPAVPGVALSPAEYAALVLELDTLRAAHRRELAQRLHEVQTIGTTSDYDDHLAVLEETAVDRARIAQLDELVRCATVLDGEEEILEGAAGLGSKVEVADAAGRTAEYQLVGRRSSTSPADELSLSSPVGRALAGARAGDVIHVRLPNGRDRVLTVLAVTSDTAPRRG